MTTDTAQRILDCTEALIVERGYNAFSYADIAEVVQVSKASIHFHYATKAVLAEKLVLRYREAARAGLGQVSAAIPDAAGRLRAYSGYWEQCIPSRSAPFCVCAMLAAEMPTLPQPVAAQVRAHFRELSGWLAATLEEGARQGVLRFEHPAAQEAETFMALVHGAMLAARVYGHAEDGDGGAQVFGALTGAAIARLQSPPS